ncbi:MAG TPA: 6-phosphogluconolactonase [Myxococcaceae bacterium]|nr:6-phosphogluconolactonase [Myxococcaceae bacterium]
MSELRICQTADALARESAEYLVERAIETVKARGRWTVALSGGSTPERLFQCWAEPALRDRMPWAQVHLFWGDERHVPPDHEDSNYGMALRAFISSVPITEANVYRMPAENSDAATAAAAYEETLRRFFALPNNAFPRFDLMLMGLGPDGHTASMFPGNDALTEGRRWVVAPYVPQFSTYRISITFPVINAAEEVMMLVSGESKAPAVKEVREGPRDPLRLPAQAIAPRNGRMIWWLDRSAARDLRPPVR